MNKTPLEQLEDLLTDNKGFYGNRFPQFMTWIEAIKPAEKVLIEGLQGQVTKLQQFKDFVHGRLDKMGVPTHPNGIHSIHGCRIGDRLDMVERAVNKAKKRNILQREYKDLKPGEGVRILQGAFAFQNGKLDFHCQTQDVEFAEVRDAITALRDECQRQLDNQEQCPFHK